MLRMVLSPLQMQGRKRNGVHKRGLLLLADFEHADLAAGGAVLDQLGEAALAGLGFFADVTQWVMFRR